MSFQFSEDGNFKGTDGGIVMTARYSVTSEQDGIFVQFSDVSDNGKPNCQGRSADHVRKNFIRSALVRFESNSDRLRFYYGYSDKFPYMLLVRSK